MKRCPYCAEEIQDEAIICRYCGHQVNGKVQIKPERKSSTRKIITGLILLFVFYIIYGICEDTYGFGISDSSTSSRRNNISSSNQDLCEWLVQAQTIRNKRINDANSYLQWLEKYSYTEVSSQGIVELAFILQEQINYHYDFIDDWNELGSQTEASSYWSKESNMVSKRIKAFKVFLEGIETSDENKIVEGNTLWEDAIFLSNDAEDELRILLNKCK